jgi:hypothetical protein
VLGSYRNQGVMLVLWGSSSKWRFSRLSQEYQGHTLSLSLSLSPPLFLSLANFTNFANLAAIDGRV